ncbi:LolA family protein [Natronolimnohabitans innermongolicus]|uniref:Outer membrane lipoprotein-sorting protein-like protein n=1 Tax=Natronolimnohabitans innermongolicus JCM 12255 TaxID=1227499 RepID=L9XIH8_9EURY|nr:hypothetical protein [Natronolimnohabitans innermongolicus]ELY61226.1 Outer membrane lipoprotein-sorting protein-like protein [Natronolimnohabitans innermongolicus JCM 12255]
MLSRRVLVGCCLVVLLLLGGCVSYTAPGDDPDEPADPDVDAESLFEAAFVHGDTLEDVEGTVISEATDGNQTLGDRERIQERPYTDRRSETLEASNADRDGTVYVANETTRWWYYPELQAADYYVPADAPFDDDEIRAERAETAETELEKHNIEYRGTEEVADRETHVLDVEAKNETVERGISVLVGNTEYIYALETVDLEAEDEYRIVEQTLWIDAEYEYPLKEEVVWEGPDGTEIVMTERFESVTFNSGFGDETFDFEPPDDVDVYEDG